MPSLQYRQLPTVVVIAVEEFPTGMYVFGPLGTRRANSLKTAKRGHIIAKLRNIMRSSWKKVLTDKQPETSIMFVHIMLWVKMNMMRL